MFRLKQSTLDLFTHFVKLNLIHLRSGKGAGGRAGSKGQEGRIWKVLQEEGCDKTEERQGQIKTSIKHEHMKGS